MILVGPCPKIFPFWAWSKAMNFPWILLGPLFCDTALEFSSPGMELFVKETWCWV